MNQSKQNTETSESTDEVKKENQQLRKKIASVSSIFQAALARNVGRTVQKYVRAYADS